MARKLTWVMLAAVASASVSAADARADYNWFWGGMGGPNRLYQSDREIPYFAEHPPVYYSHIVPRTYGQSPYAYWPGPYTPMIAPEPIFIPNPYVEPEEVAPPAGEPSDESRNSGAPDKVTRRSGGPLVVLNPYVEQQPTVVSRSR